jgi:hypothetical protein
MSVGHTRQAKSSDKRSAPVSKSNGLQLSAGAAPAASGRKQAHCLERVGDVALELEMLQEAAYLRDASRATPGLQERIHHEEGDDKSSDL